MFAKKPSIVDPDGAFAPSYGKRKTSSRTAVWYAAADSSADATVHRVPTSNVRAITGSSGGSSPSANGSGQGSSGSAQASSITAGARKLSPTVAYSYPAEPKVA